MDALPLKEALARFSRLVSDAEEQAKEHSDTKDLTATQLSYIETIEQLGNPNITELSVALGLKKPSVTVVVDRLITKGCVYKTHSDADRRTAHLHLTDVGSQINRRHDYAHDYLSQLVADSLTTEEQQQFTAMLHKVIDTIKNK